MRASSIHIVAGDLEQSKSRLAAFDEFLDAPTSFLNAYRPKESVDSAIVLNQHKTRHIELRKPNYNPFFQLLYIFSTPFTEWNVSCTVSFAR